MLTALAFLCWNIASLWSCQIYGQDILSDFGTGLIWCTLIIAFMQDALIMASLIKKLFKKEKTNEQT